MNYNKLLRFERFFYHLMVKQVLGRHHKHDCIKFHIPQFSRHLRKMIFSKILSFIFCFAAVSIHNENNSSNSNKALSVTEPYPDSPSNMTTLNMTVLNSATIKNTVRYKKGWRTFPIRFLRRCAVFQVILFK